MELSEGASAKYRLRTKSIRKRIESERTRHTNSNKRKEGKEKEKPPPLSKYRRKTANARERNRMKEINDAFVNLQSTLPDIPGTDADKLTKIMVLKLAVTYISALAGVLGDTSMSMDVEEIRQMWCLDNAHVTKTDHGAKSPPKNSLVKKEEQIPHKQLIKVPSINRSTTIAPTKKKPPCSNGLKLDDIKDKYLHTIKPTAKKSGKSRSRGKICRTNSVATNNGAYITLKNCAMQTTHNPRSRVINNQPVMMSMTVKRTRMEPVVGHRSIKMRKYEPLLAYSIPEVAHFNAVGHRQQNTKFASMQQSNITTENSVMNSLVNHSSTDYMFDIKPQFTTAPQYNFLPLQSINQEKPFNYGPIFTSNPNQINIDSKVTYSSPPLSYPVSPPQIISQQKYQYYPGIADSSQLLTVQTSSNCFPMGGLSFKNLDSPPVRNDVLLEFPPETKLSSSSDSAFSSGESAPSSPILSVQSHTPPIGDLSPFSSLTNLSGGSTSACSISSRDCDSVFNGLLDCEPFQEELDHFTSAFNVGGNSFNLFIDQTSSAFVNCDVDEL